MVIKHVDYRHSTIPQFINCLYVYVCRSPNTTHFVLNNQWLLLFNLLNILKIRSKWAMTGDTWAVYPSRWFLLENNTAIIHSPVVPRCTQARYSFFRCRLCVRMPRSIFYKLWFLRPYLLSYILLVVDWLLFYIDCLACTTYECSIHRSCILGIHRL